LVHFRYFEDFEKSIPRSEIVELEEKLKKVILKLDPEYDVTICGSYRRGKATSGDIDVLLTHPQHKSSTTKSEKTTSSLKSIVEALESTDIVIDTISLGHNKFMVISLT
jgi:DNA polymerase beta